MTTTQTATAFPVSAPVVGRVPPSGWYPTAEGSHERFWDGQVWGPARLRVRTPIHHPSPPPSMDPSSMDPDPAAELPDYATVPPMSRKVDPYDEIHGTFRPRPARVPSRFAWMVALAGLWAVLTLVAFDFAGEETTRGISAWFVIVPVLFVLAMFDASLVRGRGHQMSRLWCLAPSPIYLAARTRAASSSLALPVVALVVTVATLASWYAPMSALDPIAALFPAAEQITAVDPVGT